MPRTSKSCSVRERIALPALLILAAHCSGSPPTGASDDRPAAGSSTSSGPVAGAPGGGGGGGSTSPSGGSSSGSVAPGGGASGERDAAAATPDAGSSSVSMPLPTTFTKQVLDLATYPQAVCNDGSPGAYYAEAGTDAATWVILLEGGSWCTSDADCSNRGADLTSSKGLAETITPAGILASDVATNPHFANANRIDVSYCTSDVFSGTTGPTGGTNDFSFQGKAVFAAVVDDLVHRFGLGAAGQSVLLAGVSAGGVSVLVSADRLAAAIPNAKVRALVDAGFLPDVAPLAGPSIVRQFQTGMAFWKGDPDDSCAAKNPGQEMKCYLGQYAQPEIGVPLFFGQSLEDPHGPLHAGGFTLPTAPSPAQLAWVNQTYTPAVETLLGAMPASVGSFSPCKVIHTMADNSAWTTLSVGGTLYDDAVFDWWNGAPERLMATPCTLE